MPDVNRSRRTSEAVVSRRYPSARDQQRVRAGVAAGIPLAVYACIQTGWLAAIAFVAIWTLVLILLASAGRIPERFALIGGAVVGVVALAWCFVTILR